MSAALDALTIAIATNTLTAAQQGALTQALSVISPLFPSPDQSSSADAPPDGLVSREWIAALYAIQAGGGGGGVVPITSVLGTPPIEAVTAGPVVTVSIDAATDATPGSLSAADKTKLDTLVALPTADLTAAGLVKAISGPSPIVVAPAIFQWAQGTVAPGWSQAQQANGSVPQAMSFTPQAPGAAAVGANGVPANFTINLAAPVGGTTEGFFQVNRAGALSSYLGCFPGAPTVIGCAWIGLLAATPPSATNFTVANEPANGTVILNGVSAASGLCTLAFFTDGATGRFLVGKDAAGGAGFDITPGAATNWAGGVKVVGLNNATTEPTSNVATKTHFWAFTNGAFKTRSANGWLANLAALGNGAVNTQKPFADTFSAVVRTVSSATPTAFSAYTTVSDAGGLITVQISSKAATVGVGIAVGDFTASTYVLAYKNVAGTVTLSTAGITLVGAAQTTAAALTATLTAAAVGATVVFSVTNVNLATIDSQIDCTIKQC